MRQNIHVAGCIQQYGVGQRARRGDPRRVVGGKIVPVERHPQASNVGGPGEWERDVVFAELERKRLLRQQAAVRGVDPHLALIAFRVELAHDQLNTVLQAGGGLERDECRLSRWHGRRRHLPEHNPCRQRVG